MQVVTKYGFDANIGNKISDNCWHIIKKIKNGKVIKTKSIFVLHGKVYIYKNKQKVNLKLDDFVHQYKYWRITDDFKISDSKRRSR